MRSALLAGLAVLLLAPPPASADDDVRFRLALHGRFTDQENHPDPTLLFDRSRRAIDLAPYLRTQGQDSYVSTFVSLGAQGRHGRLLWAVAADTGEVREQAFPALAQVCASNASPTGLDVVGSGRCNGLVGRRANVTLEETALGPSQVTSNGRPFADEAKNTLLLREAWLGAVFGKNDFALVKLGRKRFTVADGFVFDDYGTGVEATFDLGALGPSWEIGVSAFWPTRDFPDAGSVRSPMLAARADWLPSLFEHVGVFLAFYRDRASSVAELFRGSFAEPSVLALRGRTPGTPAFVSEERTLAAVLGRDRESEADLGWAGTSGSLRVLGGTLDFTGALNFGTATITLPTAGLVSDSTVLGKLARVRGRRSIGADVELGAFFLYLSGDLPPTQKKRLGIDESYGGFLGISPYVTETNLFFSGGVAETFATRQATAPGVNGRGVLSPGLSASWDPLRSLGLDARAAYLVAPEVGPFGGRIYGTEVDLEVSWSPASWLTFLAEGDVLFPGDFFSGRAPVTKVVLGVDVVAM